MKLPSYKDIELNKQTITYIVLVVLIIYLSIRKSLVVMGLMMFFVIRWIVLAIGLYYIIYGDKTTGLLILLLLVVAIYTHTYIPSSITKENFEVMEEVIDDPESADYKEAVETEEKQIAEEEKKRNSIQKNAINLKPKKGKNPRVKPRSTVNLKNDRYVPPGTKKNIDDNVRQLHEKFHNQIRDL